MKLYVKNMVCNRCIMVVKEQVENQGFHTLSVELGEVTLENEISESEKNSINQALQKYGFLLIDDKKSKLIERVKNLIVELVHQNNSDLKITLSDYLSANVHHDYNYLSSLFSEVEGTSIEKYFIAQKIEKVKELLVYDELTLSEIAYRLNYSSVAYLSSQFKKVTDLTPSHFKNIRGSKRIPIDEV